MDTTLVIPLRYRQDRGHFAIFIPEYAKGPRTQSGEHFAVGQRIQERMSQSADRAAWLNCRATIRPALVRRERGRALFHRDPWAESTRPGLAAGEEL